MKRFKIGDKIPADLFHVSKTNVNVNEPFGETKEDKTLVASFRAGKKIVQLFKARPEDKDGHWKPGMDWDLAVGLGVYMGRRRLLGGKGAGAKFFVFGEHCLINEVTDEEAEDASWTENFKGYHRGMNPLVRAKRLNRIVSRHPRGLRGYARSAGIPVSSLSEYLQPLKLSPKMQEALANGLIVFSDALLIVRMKLSEERQNDLAELLETEGLDAFKSELRRIVAKGRMHRGIPPGVYHIIRTVWDKRNKRHMKCLDIVTKVAESKGMEPHEYVTDFVIRRIDDVSKELAAQ